MNTVFGSIGILLDAFFLALLSWCAYTDWKTRAVSNLPVAMLVYLGLVKVVLTFLPGSALWWHHPAGLLLSIPFLITWYKNNMGAADVKLIMAIGLYLGLLNTLVSFALMIPILAVSMVCTWLKKRTMKCRIPLAPVLTFGAVATIALRYLHLPH